MLIENASQAAAAARHPCSRRFRSSLATTYSELCSATIELQCGLGNGSRLRKTFPQNSRFRGSGLTMRRQSPISRLKKSRLTSEVIPQLLKGYSQNPTISDIARLRSLLKKETSTGSVGGRSSVDMNASKVSPIWPMPLPTTFCCRLEEGVGRPHRVIRKAAAARTLEQNIDSGSSTTRPERAACFLAAARFDKRFPQSRMSRQTNGNEERARKCPDFQCGCGILCHIDLFK